MRVIGDKNQISEDVFDYMISYLPFPQMSIRSELAKLFSISIFLLHGLKAERSIGHESKMFVCTFVLFVYLRLLLNLNMNEITTKHMVLQQFVILYGC